MKRSSTSEQPEPVFFVDRDLGPTVAAVLRAGGLRIEAYHEHFAAAETPDVEWLRLVGQRGWVALTHNKRIRYERDELDELMTSHVKAFFIIGKGPHPALARAVLRNAGRIRRLIRRHAEPFVAKVYQEREEVEVWITYDQWRKDRRSRRRAPHPTG
jgi:hypothetical protein